MYHLLFFVYRVFISGSTSYLTDVLTTRNPVGSTPSSITQSKFTCAANTLAFAVVEPRQWNVRHHY